MKKTLYAVLICSLCIATGCGRSGEKTKVEAAYTRYIQAFQSADSDGLKLSTTDEMCPLTLVGLNAAKAFGIDLAGMHVSHSVDKIEGDTAYVNTESIFKGQTLHERVVLKRRSGKWLVAGKQ